MPSQKLPKAERIRMIDARIKALSDGKGDFPPARRKAEINHLLNLRYEIFNEEENSNASFSTDEQKLLPQ